MLSALGYLFARELYLGTFTHKAAITISYIAVRHAKAFLACAPFRPAERRGGYGQNRHLTGSVAADYNQIAEDLSLGRSRLAAFLSGESLHRVDIRLCEPNDTTLAGHHRVGGVCTDIPGGSGPSCAGNMRSGV